MCSLSSSRRISLVGGDPPLLGRHNSGNLFWRCSDVAESKPNCVTPFPPKRLLHTHCWVRLGTARSQSSPPRVDTCRVGQVLPQRPTRVTGLATQPLLHCPRAALFRDDVSGGSLPRGFSRVQVASPVRASYGGMRHTIYHARKRFSTMTAAFRECDCRCRCRRR